MMVLVAVDYSNLATLDCYLTLDQRGQLPDWLVHFGAGLAAVGVDVTGVAGAAGVADEADVTDAADADGADGAAVVKGAVVVVAVADLDMVPYYWHCLSPDYHYIC